MKNFKIYFTLLCKIFLFQAVHLLFILWKSAFIEMDFICWNETVDGLSMGLYWIVFLFLLENF